MYNSYVDLNKVIIDQQAIAVVPGKKVGRLPISDLDIEEDYIFFCLTKFTKTMISIQNLIKNDLYEDALILTRSNYECLIHAKAIVENNNMITHLVEYKFGLLNEKRYKFTKNNNGRINRSRIADIDNPNEEFNYIHSISSIANQANERVSYEHIYSYFCDITHCNFITSAYYRDGVNYSYEMVNDLALYNVLLWNVYFSIKFYITLIDAEIFEIEELEERVLDVLLSDPIKLLKVFEDEEKKVIQDINKLTDENAIKSLQDYLHKIKIIKGSL